MFERLKEIFSRINFTRNKKVIPAEKDNSAETEQGGKIYAAWLLVLPLLVGFVLGRLADVGIGFALDKFAGNSGVNAAAVTGAHALAGEESKARGLDGFLASNPFKISPQKPPEEPKPEPKKEEEVKQPDPPSTLDDYVLRGTLPGVGAWIEKDGKLKLLLVGKSIERYKLTSVKYTEAMFRKGRERVTKYITYGPVVQVKKEEPPKPAPTPAKAPEPAPKQNDSIVAAAPGAQEGEVPAEIINSLVQNPFDELKRIRMRPNEKAGGLEIQWIQNDSILKRLGVQRGDIIKSVNGIPFTNMGDIANSINSLMNSERFDVEVTRGGNPTALRYVVR